MPEPNNANRHLIPNKWIIVATGSCYNNQSLKKDGKPSNQVPEEGFKSEESWHEILHILNLISSVFSI